MRPRIRTVKPEFFQDEGLWDLATESGLPVHLAFAGLWCFADREGRFEWRPRALKAGILPYWDGDFSRVLDALTTRGFVVKYTSAGREYGWVRTFQRHQVLNNRESPSELPDPNVITSEVMSIDACPTRDSRVPHASEAEGKGMEGSGKGMEGSGSVARTQPLEPEPPSSPEVTQVRVIGSGGVARTYTMPCEKPPKDYLDEAVMRAVPPDAARETWEFWWTKGLPAVGVEKLYPWLLKLAKGRANESAKIQPRAGPRGGSDRGAVLAMMSEELERQRAEEAEEEARKGVAR